MKLHWRNIFVCILLFIINTITNCVFNSLEFWVVFCDVERALIANSHIAVMIHCTEFSSTTIHTCFLSNSLDLQEYSEYGYSWMCLSKFQSHIVLSK